MEEIHKKSYLVHYFQVGLWDAEDLDAYPQWETGEEEVILGPKGILVATANDTLVEITLYDGEGETDGINLLKDEIQVGHQGLIVGNETTADTSRINWPAGKTSVAVYVDKQPRHEVTSVKFVLTTESGL